MAPDPDGDTLKAVRVEVAVREALVALCRDGVIARPRAAATARASESSKLAGKATATA